MYTVRFTFKGVMCELVESFDSFASAWAVAQEYRSLSGVSVVRVYSHNPSHMVADEVAA